MEIHFEALQGESGGGEAMIFMIRGRISIPCITTSIARWTLQQFYDYPGSDEPSDSFIQIYERVE